MITRYNKDRSVSINGGPAPEISSGSTLDGTTKVSDVTIPEGYKFEWTGTAYQETAASGQTGIILSPTELEAHLRVA